ncbi:hypothetical protein GWI34_21920 [Actinomadura sp. DSM 109109]|nr:hypothetical protein [Actinomadura lepetitiana]
MTMLSDMTTLSDKAMLSDTTMPGRMTMPGGMTMPGQDPSWERIPAAVPDELAARVVALRRARREARTRASRVRRVLLAPTAAGEAYAHVPAPRHRD